MNKLNALIIVENMKKLFQATESAARGSIEKILPDSDNNLIRVHSDIFTQYVVQFATYKLVKAGSKIEQRMFNKIKRSIFEYTIDRINLINHPIKNFAKIAAESIKSRSTEDTCSRVLLIEQVEAFQENKDFDEIAFYVILSKCLDGLFSECEMRIKTTKFEMDDRQPGFFSDDINDASSTGGKSTLRNTRIK